MPRPESLGATRIERKFILSLRSGRCPESHVRRHVPALGDQHPARTVNSLYFDTSSYACYQQSAAGDSARLKVRLRWYGESTGPILPVLELKRRANHLGWKTAWPVGPLDLRKLAWPDLRQILLDRTGPEARIALNVVHVPVLVTTYRRIYLVTPDLGIRVTIDSGLGIFDQRWRSRLNLTFDWTRATFSILECKAASERQPEVSRLLRPLGVQQTRFSKYSYGLDCLTGA